jgi:hypothetical protein
MKFITSILILVVFPLWGWAQFQSFRDSVVQISGLTMTSDSLRGIPAVSILVKGQNRGTISNSQGVFSIVAFKGDTLTFTAVGFQKKDFQIPPATRGNSLSIIQLMSEDTIYLAETIISPYPTRKEFERMFVDVDMPDDMYERARKNNDQARMRMLARTIAPDAAGAYGMFMQRQQQSLYYAGQRPPQNIFNPLAWAQFIEAWKRGDYKRKK